MDLEVVERFTMHDDNEISIVLIKNLKSQYQKKHINVQSLHLHTNR